MATQELISTLRSLFEKMAEVRLALLFGSQAVGKAGDRSDIDLAVDAPKEMLGPIAARVSEATGREVDVVFLDQATIPLLRHLIDHCIVVHQAKPGVGAMWRSHTLAELETDGPLYDRMKNAWLARVAVHGVANQDDHTRGIATQDDHMPVGVIHGQS